MPAAIRKLLPALLVMAAVVGGYEVWAAHERHIGALQATIKVRDAAIDSLAALLKRLDSAYALDTSRFSRERQSYEVAKATLLRQLAAWQRRPVTIPVPLSPIHPKGDSLPVGDTMPTTIAPPPFDPGPATDFIHAADSALAACSVVVLSCEKRADAQKARADSLGVQLTAERGKDRLPLFHVKLPSRSASLVGGLAAGVVLCKLFCPK